MASYFVDGDNGVDLAGEGTSELAAYRTLQFAIDDVLATHGKGASGDNFQITGNFTESLDTSQYLTDEGVPYGLAIIGRGESGFSDAGRPTLDLDGGQLFTETKEQTLLKDLIITNWDDTDYCFRVTFTVIDNCLFTHATGQFGIRIDEGTRLVNSKVVMSSQVTVEAVRMERRGTSILNCEIEAHAGSAVVANHGSEVANSVIRVEGAGNGVSFNTDQGLVRNCTLLGSGIGSTGCLGINDFYEGHRFIRNYFENFERGIHIPGGQRGGVIISNRFFGCDTNINLTDDTYWFAVQDNVELDTLLDESPIDPGNYHPRDITLLLPGGQHVGAKTLAQGSATIKYA